MSLPREAREGLMRAWLDILKERHPEVTWIAKGDVAEHPTHAEPTNTAQQQAA